MVPIGKPRLMKGQQFSARYGTNFISLLKTAEMPARDQIEQQDVEGNDAPQPSIAPEAQPQQSQVQPQQNAQQVNPAQQEQLNEQKQQQAKQDNKNKLEYWQD